MRHSNFARRTGRLLGAVTVTGVLAAGLLATPADAATRISDETKDKASLVVKRVGHSNANGLVGLVQRANGL